MDRPSKSTFRTGECCLNVMQAFELKRKGEINIGCQNCPTGCIYDAAIQYADYVNSRVLGPFGKKQVRVGARPANCDMAGMQDGSAQTTHKCAASVTLTLE